MDKYWMVNAYQILKMSICSWMPTISCSLFGRYESKYRPDQVSIDKTKETPYTLRGGGWYSEPASMRSAVRDQNRANHAKENVGFRVIL